MNLLTENIVEPKLRFNEFRINWNVKKLKDLVKINQGLQIPISDRYKEKIEGSYFYITNEFLKSNSEKKYFVLNPNKSVLCDVNDILMTRTGNTGKVVTNVKGVFHNNFFKIAYPDTIAKDFLFYFLNLKSTQNTIKRLAGTSTIPDLNHSDFYRIYFSFPFLTEQKKIASFLSAVDKKLQQLTKKKELLEEYKKGVMQKIFSQEIRFTDANGSNYPDWENKKLGEVGETFNGLTGKTKVDFGRGKPFIQYMQIFNSAKIDTSKFGYVDINEGEKQKTAKYGDIFFTTSSETPLEIGYASVLTEEVEEVYLNSFCFGYRHNSLTELYPDFSSYLFRSEFLRKQIVKLAQGSTRYNMSKVQLMKVLIQLPSLDEQQKIANFLSSIDKKIELVNTQIENTKAFKKGLLQQMFV